MKQFTIQREPMESYKFTYFEDGRVVRTEHVYGKDRMRDTVFYLIGFLGFTQIKA